MTRTSEHDSSQQSGDTPDSTESRPAKPLDLMRRIRDDKSLSSTQKHVLHVAVLRMDNVTGKVKASHELLAADAGVSSKSVGRVFSSPEVSGYVRTVDKRRGKDHWMRTTPPKVDTKSTIESSEGGLTVPDTGHSVQVGGLSVPDTGHSVHPSVSTSPFTSAISSAVGEQTAAEKEDGPSFVSPTDRTGSEWTVQVWTCAVCGQGGKEHIAERSETTLTYLCSYGFLVQTNYSAARPDERSLGYHYVVSPENRQDIPVRVLAIGEEDYASN